MKNKANLGLFDQIKNQVESRKGGKRNAQLDKENQANQRQWTEKGFSTMGSIQTRSITGIMLDVTNDAAEWKRYGVQHQQRAWQLIDELGIKFLTDCQANVVYPCINCNNSQWVAEGESMECSTAFEGLNLHPRRLVSLVDYSNQIILSTDADLDKEIESDLIESVFEKVQDTMFNDIFDAESASTLSSYDDLVALELAASQKKISNGVYLVSPIAASKLKKMKNGQVPVMNNGMINGYRVIETPSLDGEKVIFGDFSKLLLAQFGIGLDITLNDVTKQAEGIIELVINSYWDWGKVDEKGFVFGTTEQ